MTDKQNVFYLAVARMSAGKAIIVGSHAHKNVITDPNGVRQVLEQSHTQLVEGKHFSTSISNVDWHFIEGKKLVFALIVLLSYPDKHPIFLRLLTLIFLDRFPLIYILICQQGYPQRVAHSCLEELQQQVAVCLFLVSVNIASPSYTHLDSKKIVCSHTPLPPVCK
jgi:hypothetical protein